MKIPNGINADSSKEYKLEFLNKTVNYNGTAAGEAPQLSPVYAEYDNGANVFNSYVNGDTPTSDFNNASGISISQVTNVDYRNRTINALYVSGLDNQNEPAIIYKKALPNQPTIIQSNFMHLSSEAGGLGASNGEGTLTNDISPSSSSSSISVEAGFGSSLFSQAYDISGTYKNDINQNGSDNSNWNYASLTYYGNSASSWYAYISPQLYSTAGGYSGTVDNNPLSSSSNLYMGVGLVSTSSNDEYQSYYNYILSITYPPNGVMPSVSFGAVLKGNQNLTTTSSETAPTSGVVDFINSQNQTLSGYISVGPSGKGSLWLPSGSYNVEATSFTNLIYSGNFTSKANNQSEEINFNSSQPCQ
jgi:hypothetical protein